MDIIKPKKQKASGRTPEQQAARDARKAKAILALASTSTSTQAPLISEAIEDVANLHNESTKSLKRSWDESQASADSHPSGLKKNKEIDIIETDRNLLEIDPDLPAPLSRAEARAAKKRNKLAAKSETVENNEVAPLRERPVTSHANRTSRQHSIWIGNLAFKTTSETLKSFLEQGIVELGGEPDSITRVNLPKPPHQGNRSANHTLQQNKGFAYCDFKSESLKTLALQLSERPLDGRRVLIKEGNDHAPSPNARTPKPDSSSKSDQRVLSKQPHSETSTLFVGNLPFDATEDQLRDLVEKNAVEALQSGETTGNDDCTTSSRGGVKSGLVKARVATFQDTGRCKGFAFLDFKSPSHAKVALLNKKNHFFRSNKLVIQFASEEATKRSGRFSHEPRSIIRKDRTSNNDNKDTAQPLKLTKEDESEVNMPRHEGEAMTLDVSGRDKRGKKWESRGRPPPGAALAMARRQQIGIVESQGAKTTFD